VLNYSHKITLLCQFSLKHGFSVRNDDFYARLGQDKDPEFAHVGGLDQGATYVTTSANPPAVGNDKLKPPYIVIIEDYEPLSRALCEMFRLKGNRCFAIRSKTSAEQFLRQVRPDLVVLDYQLMGGVGLEAAQIASENNVPVIITSGHHNIRERIGKFGYPYLVKPFAPSELLRLASKALGIDMGPSQTSSIQILIELWTERGEAFTTDFLRRAPFYAR
jgi:CheY-like chemotaxis protein